MTWPDTFAVPQGTSKNLTIPVQVQLTSGTYLVSLYPGPHQPSSEQRPLARANIALTVH